MLPSSPSLSSNSSSGNRSSLNVVSSEERTEIRGYRREKEGRRGEGRGAEGMRGGDRHICQNLGGWGT